MEREERALGRQQMQMFADNGYVVVPQVVPHELVTAAREEIHARIAREPPGTEHRGPYHYFLTDALPQPLIALLFASSAITAAQSLVAPGTFEAPDHVQIALNIPPWNHRPGGPHIDGLTPPEPDGRPATFTLLAGIFLTDQTKEGSGNLWVWPGSHRLAAAYFSQYGPDKLRSSAPYPPVELPIPQQVLGRAGDVLLAHYLLGHNMGGNTSATVREVVYFRLRREGHRGRWRDFVQDELTEFDPVRMVG
jgi:ectoine hydroxylase-related dioxygenase (phytanoyl-CoA dioxygenase family)